MINIQLLKMQIRNNGNITIGEDIHKRLSIYIYFFEKQRRKMKKK